MDHQLRSLPPSQMSDCMTSSGRRIGKQDTGCRKILRCRQSSIGLAVIEIGLSSHSGLSFYRLFLLLALVLLGWRVRLCIFRRWTWKIIEKWIHIFGSCCLLFFSIFGCVLPFWQDRCIVDKVLCRAGPIFWFRLVENIF